MPAWDSFSSHFRGGIFTPSRGSAVIGHRYLRLSRGTFGKSHPRVAFQTGLMGDAGGFGRVCFGPVAFLGVVFLPDPLDVVFCCHFSRRTPAPPARPTLMAVWQCIRVHADAASIAMGILREAADVIGTMQLTELDAIADRHTRRQLRAWRIAQSSGKSSCHRQQRGRRSSRANLICTRCSCRGRCDELVPHEIGGARYQIFAAPIEQADLLKPPWKPATTVLSVCFT